MRVQYAPLPYREPWMGLPGGSRGEEQVGRLHRELMGYSGQLSRLQDDLEAMEECIKLLDEVSRERIRDIFGEAIRDCGYEIETREQRIAELQEDSNGLV